MTDTFSNFIDMIVETCRECAIKCFQRLLIRCDLYDTIRLYLLFTDPYGFAFFLGGGGGGGEELKNCSLL